MSLKKAGHPCPDCKAMPCAEFAPKGEPARWKCNACGAGGFLALPPAPLKPAEPPKKHWRDAGRVTP